LRRLEDEGFVETALNRWTRVTPLDFTRALESYTIIETLELLALELAFPGMTRDDLQRMSSANRAMHKAAEPPDAVKADEDFHEVWIGRANNSELFALIEQLKRKIRRVELAYFDAASRADESFREHTAIIKALRRRSLAKARLALQSNWRGSVERFRAVVRAD
jgi:DNA-binding GntR family transcriptional regulator